MRRRLLGSNVGWVSAATIVDGDAVTLIRA
jgi:hypothetical protein